ncbi:alcohol oxidase [Sparassis latifolia]|uniref:Dehydrogenase citC n=1 Tax=Sparassis crispa TaxID=139825 RepID=A0A401GK25_9APHY|nr:Dehydrogenase citC [Sparassis crispa]GBE82510.1 Dehydrogenase citC [Sparassis crispa]
MISLLGALLATLFLASLGLTFPTDVYHHHRELRARNIVYSGQIADAYDFIIVGGGVAGLTLASRLSEDANTTVLVLEAGDTGDAVSNQINTPGNTYYNGLVGSSCDWAYLTVPQPNVANRQLSWPMGKVIGGSSAINGMYLVRPSQIEIDAWAALVSPSDNGSSAAAYQWDNFFAALKKTETFTPPSSAIQQDADIQFNTASHGTSGPLHYSYPGFEFSQVGSWTPTLAAAGVIPNQDAYGGDGWGTFVATSAINPTNWTRSYAKSAYIDPLPPRSNLDILPNATVTRIVWSSSSSSNNVTASGVEYATSRGAPTTVVSVKKEVILTGGAVGSPHVLLVSGVGPSDVLSAAGVNVTVNLPGVGQHLQDHLSTQIIFTTHDDTAASLLPANAGNPAFMSFINSAVGYVNASILFDNVSDFQAGVVSSMSNALVPSTDPTVLAGYKAIYETTTNLLTTPVGQVEVLLNLVGSASGGTNTIGIEVGIQHPYSHGRLYINSSSIFDAPVIDPNYLSNPNDIVLLRQGLKLARQIGATPPLSTGLLAEVSPGPSVNTDDGWQGWLVNQIGTEYHPSSACSQLPLNLGGVVDSNLKVYGLGNVRVADSSIYPFAFSAHLQAPTYALGELAADIIRAYYNGTPAPGANATSTSADPTTSSNSTPSPSATQRVKSGATTLTASVSAVWMSLAASAWLWL